MPQVLPGCWEPSSCETRPQPPHWPLDLSDFAAKGVRVLLSLMPGEGLSTLYLAWHCSPHPTRPEQVLWPSGALL